ncbi:glycoside hydrolase family 53 protein [Inconstantimicrobium mannanitabidum]|uniref:Uncharacterized protein n=1 Tax=Inconstantimicrobium mannanitabidum TaxID=1604901 RepID=A0ACB5RHY1_9CLOT|nr:glycosyl hydrolase 53 family protein [Clostridium sp. TW13]GKX68691.1 hypothetical protein rsdtw13_39490 [Clostridium sp. TW13]
MNFIKGMDISIFKELDHLGGKFYNRGKEEPLLKILKYYDINSIRLRLWVNPYDEEGNPYGGGTNDLETTIELAKLIKESNMSFVLDIHYSDFWTDPGKQIKPREWASIFGEALIDKVYTYTFEVISRLKEEKLIPTMVQVGNEITNGMLWGDGKLPNYEMLSKLLKSGVKAIKDVLVNNEPKIILHLDNGGNNLQFVNWFSEMDSYNVPYDIIGLSYYPVWHGTLQELDYNLNDISTRFNKEVLVVETSYGFTTNNFGNEGMIFTEELAKQTPYQPNKEGQAQFLHDLLEVISKVKNNKGIGFFYWEPAWIPVEGSTWATEAGRKYIGDNSLGGNAWANQALFDFEGNALPALETIKNFKASK